MFFFPIGFCLWLVLPRTVDGVEYRIAAGLFVRSSVRPTSCIEANEASSKCFLPLLPAALGTYKLIQAGLPTLN